MAVEPAVAFALLHPRGFDGPPPPSALVLIGPEGGWSMHELAVAAERGIPTIHLGARTLRAESVPLVALSALWTTWGW
jgi:16S rRNA (uracil1498-N3)-methyltransferase